MCFAVQATEVAFGAFNAFLHEAHDIFRHGFHAAIHTDGTNNRLKGIRQNGISASAAGAFFSLAKQQAASHAKLSGKLCQRAFADHRRAQLRQLTLRHLREMAIHIFAHNHIQHRIPQKFQTLVVFMAALFRFVGIGAVCQGQNQQIFIRKRICNFPFKFFQIQMVHIYSSSFAATSSAI